jgi:hypothetical protein
LIEEKRIPLKRVLCFSADDAKLTVSAPELSELIDSYIEDILHTTLEELDEKLFIFIDEAQSYKNWAATVETKVYNSTNNIFLIATGSSALSLGSDALGRKNTKEAIFPLNLSEYLLLTHHIRPVKDLQNDVRDVIFNPTIINLDELDNKWRLLRMRISDKKLNLASEFLRFLCLGGCPISINATDYSAYGHMCSSIRKVIYQDLSDKKSFTKKTLNKAGRIVSFLAFKKPGKLPLRTLSNRFDLPISTVHEIMAALEEAQLVFGVKPYREDDKKNSAWNFYFLHPYINATLRYKYSKFDPYDPHIQGTLIENLVAAYFFRMKETLVYINRKPVEIFYPPQTKEKNVDFLIQDIWGDVLPVEVGLNKGDDTGQVTKAISRYHCEYGILISDFPTISMSDSGVLRVPLPLFALA